MPRQRRHHQEDANAWIGYTDLLSNSLLILLVTMIAAALGKASNEKPPLLRLTEQESFRFPTGNYTLSIGFVKALDRRLPEIKTTIEKYRIDSIEVIGHTDGQPSPGTSNLDTMLSRQDKSQNLLGYQSGSNTDLGLLRALSVANYLRLKLEPSVHRKLVIRPYSAGSLIDASGRYAPADTRSQIERRRIELRFTRQDER